jgi:hypothetical protein
VGQSRQRATESDTAEDLRGVVIFHNILSTPVSAFIKLSSAQNIEAHILLSNKQRWKADLSQSIFIFF